MNIKILGDPFSISGYSKCCRDLILALSQEHDISVVLNMMDRVRDTRHQSSGSIQSLIDRDNGAEVSIQVCLPTYFVKATKFNIGCFFYEADKLPATWIDKCNEMDMILAPTEFVAKVCKDSGVTVPIKVMHFPYNPSMETDTYDIDLSKYAVKFLSIFQWDFRKGWDILFRSYWSEFLHVKDVVLVIKTYLQTAEPKELDQILQQINGLKAACGIRVNNRDYCIPPPIKIIVDNLTDGQMKDLYKKTDVFVLPSRGEGLGRIFEDAVYYNKPIIATNHSAPVEFLGDDFYKVSYNLSPCVNGAGNVNDGPFYPMTSNFAEPHLDSIKAQMRKAYDDTKYGSPILPCRDIVDSYTDERTIKEFGAAVVGLV